MPDMRTKQVVKFECPLPPVSLRANSRAHWATKKKDADEYSEDVLLGYGNWEEHVRGPMYFPYAKAHVRYEWRYAGVQPDHGNLGGNTKYLQDILCMAPKNGAKDRWYLGIVEDDKGITAEYVAVKVKTRAEECVVITITEGEA